MPGAKRKQPQSSQQVLTQDSTSKP
jgi:hypothetical protein